MVDAADPEKIEASKNELHNLLDKPQLQGIPVSTNPNRLILGSETAGNISETSKSSSKMLRIDKLILIA